MGEKETNTYDPFDVLTENYSEDYDWQEFTIKLNSLPQTLRDLLFDPGLMEFVMDVSTDSALSEAQTKKLSEIIGEFIMGSLRDGDLPNILSQSGIAPDIAQKIRDKVGEKEEGLETPQSYRPPVKPNQSQYIPRSAPSRSPIASERPDLKIEPDINRNNIVDLRNK